MEEAEQPTSAACLTERENVDSFVAAATGLLAEIGS